MAQLVWLALKLLGAWILFKICRVAVRFVYAAIKSKMVCHPNPFIQPKFVLSLNFDGYWPKMLQFLQVCILIMFIFSD